MTFSIQSSLSAIKAFGTKMGVTANNIANVETEEFKKSTATLVEGSKENVEVEIDQPDIPGPVVVEVTNGQLTEKEMSNVDLAEEMANMISASRSYQSNVEVVNSAKQLLSATLRLGE